jgi:hypothetical protein
MAEKSMSANSYQEIWKVIPSLFEEQILFLKCYANMDEGATNKKRL